MSVLLIYISTEYSSSSGKINSPPQYSDADQSEKPKRVLEILSVFRDRQDISTLDIGPSFITRKFSSYGELSKDATDKTGIEVSKPYSPQRGR